MIRPEKKILEQYMVDYEKDTKFAAHARLLQSKWRVKKKLKMNDKIRSNYGNFLETETAKKDKSNYITDKTKTLVVEKIKEVRAQGGLIGEPRIWNNLLSSQPLCFNLFGELYYDLNLATKLFQELFPSKVDKVTKIEFEFSSRRDDPDNSAFDVYVDYDLNGQQRFFGIEVKYQENLKEESNKKALENFKKHKKEYLELTQKCGFYQHDSVDHLKNPPIAQIWRDHLLAFNMSTDSRTGGFVYLYPFQNEECHNGVKAYMKYLKEGEESKFYPVDLDTCIRTLNKINPCDWTNELLERYLGE